MGTNTRWNRRRVGLAEGEHCELTGSFILARFDSVLRAVPARGRQSGSYLSVRLPACANVRSIAHATCVSTTGHLVATAVREQY